MILLVGLGNPGERYEATRHNVGYMVIDAFARRKRLILSQRKYESYTAKTTIAGTEVVLLKPQTFMNLSGVAVDKAVKALNLSPRNVFVIYDDIDLPFGRIRIRVNGGPAGHNGIKSIADALHSEEFPRLRIGIGRPSGQMDPADYVLERFSGNEMELLGKVIDVSADAIFAVVHQGISFAMNQYNRKDLLPDEAINHPDDAEC